MSSRRWSSGAIHLGAHLGCEPVLVYLVLWVQVVSRTSRFWERVLSLIILHRYFPVLTLGSKGPRKGISFPFPEFEIRGFLHHRLYWRLTARATSVLGFPSAVRGITQPGTQSIHRVLWVWAILVRQGCRQQRRRGTIIALRCPSRLKPTFPLSLTNPPNLSS